MASAATHARKAWSSNAIGAPKIHHTVAGVFHAAAVTTHHRRRPVHQFRHDLAQPFEIQRGGDVHRPHDIGEQDRHLLVFRRVA
ncbi:hypothetical protein ABQF17_00015 [Mycolicibacterium elephantis]